MVDEGNSTHPLSSKLVARVRTWNEWKKLWQKETTFEGLMGLLHYGFRDSIALTDEESLDRFSFYLDVADRFPPSGKGQVPSEAQADLAIRTSIGELVQKAWKMICENVFAKNPEPGGFGPVYEHCLTSEAGIERLIAFLQKRNNISEPFTSGREWKIAHGFLPAFIEMTWKRGDYFHGRDASRRFFYSLRPNLAEILMKLHRGDVLLRSGMEIDATSLSVVKKYATLYHSTPEEALVDAHRVQNHVVFGFAQVFLTLDTLHRLQKSEQLA
jgi:hypothetical protein